ncbi:putative short chain dehydrogenase [Magnetofaba australis IT-1]|uniref:Putative short chain dehydrogenase n=1 Tax=Magnetofaba australis IT-1 TaxID=1434232 RepID=A0A1Y2K5H5_9PROT|nr:putative short chain dehydrogenase [Magnetofaba australis IT-1]
MSNRPDGEEQIRKALGDDVIILPYVHPGFALSKAAAEAFVEHSTARGMVLLRHGLITWGPSAKAAYNTHIEFVNLAEGYLERTRPATPTGAAPSVEQAQAAYRAWAPTLRGKLATPSGRDDIAWKRAILRPIIDDATLALLNSPVARELLVTPPLTSDHLIRTKMLPLWVDTPDQLDAALDNYIAAYGDYCDANWGRTAADTPRFDPLPRVILCPSIGAVCVGPDAPAADIARDITAQTLAVKATIGEPAEYEGLSAEQCFDMEYFPLQLAKLRKQSESPLRRHVAVITGAAGAIGAGICRYLLEQGCHVAATDLPGDGLDSLTAELAGRFGARALGVPLDVTSPEGIAEAYGQIIDAWGGIDLVIINAGLAHVSTLKEMDLARFQLLEKVNVEGTLNLLTASAKLFEQQNTGGDVVLISTKNVFAPGAGFGAYSATKAASHQLARIAVVEMAGMDVRVNMVAPDAVFSDGARKSGLWQEVGPDRMKARGLTEDGLEEYYRNRNLLKARVTADHVAHGVYYFATRQSPTTGATIPVDGGLPDATPR